MQVSQFKRNYLISQNQNSKIPYFGKEFQEKKIDETDKKILKKILKNGKISTTQIAQELNITRNTVYSKIKSLTKNEIIQGYSTLIHPEIYNFQIYQLMVNFNTVDEKTKKIFYQYCASNKNIIFYVDCVGKWNFEITCEVENQIKLQEIINEIRTEFQEVLLNIEIILVFNYLIKYEQYLN